MTETYSRVRVGKNLSEMFPIRNGLKQGDALSGRMRWAGHEARMGEERGVHRVLVGKPEGKRPLGRPRSRCEDNIKMDVQEVGGGRGDWMELAQDRALVSTVKNLRVP
jgi:hypothetical protein